jgi:hypothetical protein
MLSDYYFFMSSLPNNFFFSVEMDDSVISQSSSDSASSASSTSISDNFLTINEVVQLVNVLFYLKYSCVVIFIEQSE